MRLLKREDILDKRQASRQASNQAAQVLAGMLAGRQRITQADAGSSLARPWLGRGSRGGDAGGRRGCSAGVGDASVKRLPMGTRRRVRSKGRRFPLPASQPVLVKGDVDGQGDGRDGGRRGGRGGVQGQTVELDDTRRSVPAVAAGRKAR